MNIGADTAALNIMGHVILAAMMVALDHPPHIVDDVHPTLIKKDSLPLTMNNL
jgi:hypothetical protein